MYDLVVVGCGSGGLATARRASQYGQKVLIIESKRIGGTCVNVGCVPKKVTYNLCRVYENLHKLAKLYCIETSTNLVSSNDSAHKSANFSVNFKSFKQKRDDYVRRLNKIYENIISNDPNIEYLEGYATVQKDHILVNEKRYDFQYCLLATGSKSKSINAGINLTDSHLKKIATDQAMVPENFNELANSSKKQENSDKNHEDSIEGSGTKRKKLYLSQNPGFVLGEEYLKTSDDFFDLEAIPKKTVIIGSGYIGIEIACILSSLGSEVTLIARNNILLSHFDRILGENVAQSMAKQGIKILYNARVTKIAENSQFEFTEIKNAKSGSNEKDSIELSQNIHIVPQKNQDSANRVTIFINTPEGEIKIENIDFAMAAIGRDCDLSFITPEISQKESYITVDNNFCTSLPNIYAVGDLLGPPHMLTPYAIYCGRLLADHLFSKNRENIRDEFNVKEYVASVVFSHPPCASVGLSEDQARKFVQELSESESCDKSDVHISNSTKSDPVRVYTSTFANMLFCFQNQEEKEKSVFKIVTINDKVVGLHLFGEGADEIIQGFAVAMKMGATIHDFKNTVGVHPTAAEEVVTMK